MRKIAFKSIELKSIFCGGVVASWLVRTPPDRVVWALALAGNIVLCSWARHRALLSQCLSPPRRVNGYRRIKCLGNLAME